MKRLDRETRRKIIHFGAIILLVAVLLSGALLIVSKWEKSRGYYDPRETSPATSNDIIYDGKTYVPRDNIETVLVIGLDTYADDSADESFHTNKQADFLMLLVLDNDKKECAALQINRDTMTDVNVLGVAGQKIETKRMQIALSYSYGNGKGVSLRNTSDAVSNLLSGVKIDCSVSVTMDAVAKLNDKVGGVSVEILEDFSSIDPALVQGQVITLTGEQALTYVRSRSGVADQSNENRMGRQRQYLDALFAETKTKAAESDSFVAESALELSEFFVSNGTNDELVGFFEKVADYTFTGIRTLEGTSQVGEKYMEFTPTPSKLTGVVAELFCKEK